MEYDGIDIELIFDENNKVTDVRLESEIIPALTLLRVAKLLKNTILGVKTPSELMNERQ